MIMKYVRHKERGIWVFQKNINHGMAADVIGRAGIVSAGFVQFCLCVPSCYGSSQTLGLAALPEDTKLLRKEMGMLVYNEGSEGAKRIARERFRQVEEEGWTVAHDDAKPRMALALAGAVYVLDATEFFISDKNTDVSGGLAIWLLDEEWFKPTPDDPVRQLVKAGALIAAEIDRLLRKEVEVNHDEL